MSYDFTKSDGTPVSIPDGQVTSNQFSIDLLGRNTQGYGMYMARTLVHMLENFATTTAPATPTTGQLWYDTSSSILMVYNGASWVGVGGGSVSSDLLPSANCTPGPGVNIGSPSLQFCNVYAVNFHGTASQAKYADLAERYESDAAYAPGTVLALGGEKEVTVATSKTKVFGIVSSAPAFLMNSEAGTDETHPPVALIGRVPVRVIGKVAKFDELVLSDIPGVAVAKKGNFAKAKSFGTALALKDSDEEGLLEITLGR